MATQLAQSARVLSPLACQGGFNGEIKHCSSAAPKTRARHFRPEASCQMLQGSRFCFNSEIKHCRSAAPLTRARHGVSLASTSCQMLQGSQFSKLQALHTRVRKHTRVSVVRCEQNTEKGNSLPVWLGRIAMLSFAAAITVEITTGKGLLQNIGLTAPLPTVSLGLTAAIGLLTAYFIFDSGSKD